MLVFLLKIAVVLVIAAGLILAISHQSTGRLTLQTLPQALQAAVQDLDPNVFAGTLFTSVKNLVTDTINTPPVVLGVQVTNDTLGKVAEVLQSLPVEQQRQIQKLLCQPTPSTP